jgi:hypothetical protein
VNARNTTTYKSSRKRQESIMSDWEFENQDRVILPAIIKLGSPGTARGVDESA